MNLLSRAGRSWAPWAPVTSAMWLVAVVAGLVLTVVGWVMASGEIALDSQVAGATTSICGALLISVAGIAWTRHGYSAVRLRSEVATAELAAVLATRRHEVIDETRALVAGRGRRWFHDAHCAFATGRAWRPTTRVAAVSRGLEPCGVCQP